MNKRIRKRILFVWDGSAEMIREVMSHSGDLMENHAQLHAIHALPHESIYSYGAIVKESKRPPAAIQDLTEAFAGATESYPCFDSVELTVVFGDRIQEICLFAKKAQADLIIAAPFQQSGFSKWIHGDLNQRLSSKAHCKVLWVGDDELTSADSSGRVECEWTF